jgi:epsilon-lactone hydrolase
MSVRAELIRIGLRLFLKGRALKSLKESRERLGAAERFTPKPPAGTRTELVDAGGVKAQTIAMSEWRGDRHLLFLHGGGYVAGSFTLYRHVTWRLAAAAAARVLAVDYRLAPEHPFPAAVDDAVSAYRWLLAQGAAPNRIAVLGDSAGGGLSFAMLLKCRDGGLPLPAAGVALSPWTDLALTGRSLQQNARSDPMLDPKGAARIARVYLAGADPRHPYASPLYGELVGLPPFLIQVGSDEVLRDDSVRIAEKLRAVGSDVELEVWRRMPHVWHAFATILPEARRAIARIGAFLDQRWQQAAPLRESGSKPPLSSAPRDPDVPSPHPLTHISG